MDLPLIFVLVGFVLAVIWLSRELQKLRETIEPLATSGLAQALARF